MLMGGIAWDMHGIRMELQTHMNTNAWNSEEYVHNMQGIAQDMHGICMELHWISMEYIWNRTRNRKMSMEYNWHCMK